MEWRDQGALWSMRPHGESSAIIEVFTAAHGRHAGVVRGGAGRRMAPILQPGAQLDLTWRARLDEHMGAFTVEPIRARSRVLGDRRALAGLNAICALLLFALPERDPHRALYTRSIQLLDALEGAQDWPPLYLAWEVALLDEMGFGLDLSECAVTGATQDLAYVSPKTGRAVTRKAAGDWADRLLPLPPCLLGMSGPSREDLAAGLSTTGYFLEHRLAQELAHRPLPDARRRLVEMLGRQGV